MPDSSASNLPPSSPATPVRKLLQLFTKADPNHQRLSPTLAGHILISSAIILAGVSLYGISFGLIFALSNTWKVCPQGQVATESTSVAVPLTPTTVPSQRPSIAPVTPTAVPFPATTSTATPARPGSLSLDPAAQQPDLRQLYENIDRLGNDVSASQKIRLKTQLIQFQQAQQISCQIGVFFFANRNAALTVCTAAGILSIASLAFVSKNGWEDTNNAFINIGLTSGLVLFTTWTFSQLYGQGVKIGRAHV